MNDQTRDQLTADALGMRRAKLSEKKRALLDVLLREKGIDPQHYESGIYQAAEKTEKTVATPFSPLLTIRSSGTKIPVFFIHALLGSAFHYHHLAALLDKDQPVYALQAPGLDGIEKPLESVVDFATLYIKSIRTVQPKGPYKLGGYSLGGWIAFEMAQHLVRQGEEVSLVLILGTDIPLSVSMPLIYEQMAFLQQYQEDFEKTIIHPFLSYEQRLKLNSGKESLGVRGGTPLARLVQAHNKAVLRYDPQPYAGKITLLETVEQQARTPFDPSRGWKRLSLQEVETHLVAGNHLSMLNEPHVQDLARKITLCLNNA